MQMNEKPTPGVEQREFKGAIPLGNVRPASLNSTEAMVGSVYHQLGEQKFVDLVAAFYRGVAQDDVLRAEYPEEDLGPAEIRLRMFLIQYFGGPSTYSEHRGHPRLRARHFAFKVNRDTRDRWLKQMRAAMDEVSLPPAIDALMWDYFERAATAMLNTAD